MVVWLRPGDSGSRECERDGRVEKVSKRTGRRGCCEATSKEWARGRDKSERSGGRREGEEEGMHLVMAMGITPGGG